MSHWAVMPRPQVRKALFGVSGYSAPSQQPTSTSKDDDSDDSTHPNKAANSTAAQSVASVSLPPQPVLHPFLKNLSTPAEATAFLQGKYPVSLMHKPESLLEEPLTLNDLAAEPKVFNALIQADLALPLERRQLVQKLKEPATFEHWLMHTWPNDPESQALAKAFDEEPIVLQELLKEPHVLAQLYQKMGQALAEGLPTTFQQLKQEALASDARTDSELTELINCKELTDGEKTLFFNILNTECPQVKSLSAKTIYNSLSENNPLSPERLEAIIPQARQLIQTQLKQLKASYDKRYDRFYKNEKSNVPYGYNPFFWAPSPAFL